MLFVRDFLGDQVVLRTSAPANPPAVSVILPTYRRRASLARALETVLEQSYRDFELLVMDDGSTDGSNELIEDYRRRDSRVVHVRHELNCGLPALRVNEGIELSRGRFLAFQFDDDEWCPDGLAALVEAAEKLTEPGVIVGRARIEGSGQEGMLPDVALTAISLYEQNRLTNNSVLVPRELVDAFGMYDCHIGMRRLCDWDLWLRYIKNVPFTVIETQVAVAHANRPGAIGLTVQWDLGLFRQLHDIPRDELLKPGCWHDYEVDSLRIGGVEVEKDARRRLYEDHIVPMYLRFRHRFPQLEGFSSTLPSASKTVLYTKHSYDVSLDIGLNHYDAATQRRGTYKAHFAPLMEVKADWPQDADGLLLVRAVEGRAKALLAEGQAEGKPVGLYLDDDLLTFHEFGEEYSYLKPGSEYYRNLTELLKEADAVWATTSSIAASVKELNERIVPHNGCVPEAWLPTGIKPKGRPVRVGYVGSGYRREEFERIWGALRRVSAEHGEEVEFEFWGLKVDGLGKLASPVIERPFTFGYYNYLRRLKEAALDILLTPLLSEPKPRLGKAPSKYYQTAVAGALGIYSDVPQYADLPAGLTCLKAANTEAGWYAALSEALAMPAEQFDLLRRRALVHVRQEYTEAAQVHLHEAAWRATEFHARTRPWRRSDGRPRVIYVLHSAHFGGAELLLWRSLRLARRYGIEPIVVLPRSLQTTEQAQRVSEQLAVEAMQLEFVDYTCFTEPRSPSDFQNQHEREQVRQLLEAHNPALVHTVTFIPAFGQVCAEMGVPHVASLYQMRDSFGLLSGRPDFVHADVVLSDSLHYANRWAQLLGVPKYCARGLVPEDIFAVGRQRHLEQLDQFIQCEQAPLRLVVTGTLQERKRQLETIEAAGRLQREGWAFQLDFYGYTHFYPAYVEKCRQQIRSDRLESCVRLRDFGDDIAGILAQADVALSLSNFESFPNAVKEAMSAGVLVVATPIGGVAELVVDGVTGILCENDAVEAITDGMRRALALTWDARQQMVEAARRVARFEFHPQRAANDLLAIYGTALDVSRARKPGNNDTGASRPAARSTVAFGSVETPNRPAASFVPIGRRLAYRLAPARANWAGLDVLVGTHHRPASGVLRLRVLAETRPVREVFFDLAGAHDNDWVELRFAPIEDSAGRPFTAEFSVIGASPQTRLSLFESNASEPPSRRWLRRAGLPLPGNSLYCRMWYAG